MTSTHVCVALRRLITVKVKDTSTKDRSSRSQWRVTSISTRCADTSRQSVRAGLVERAEAWTWGSAWAQLHPEDPQALPLCEWPMARPADWLERVNQPLTGAELAVLTRSTQRGWPFGCGRWRDETAKQLGLEGTLRCRDARRKSRDKVAHSALAWHDGNQPRATGSYLFCLYDRHNCAMHHFARTNSSNPGSPINVASRRSRWPPHKAKMTRNIMTKTPRTYAPATRLAQGFRPAKMVAIKPPIGPACVPATRSAMAATAVPSPTVAGTAANPSFGVISLGRFAATNAGLCSTAAASFGLSSSPR